MRVAHYHRLPLLAVQRHSSVLGALRLRVGFEVVVAQVALDELVLVVRDCVHGQLNLEHFGRVFYGV